MATNNFVAYYRVSTDRQGQSGLGLEAQRKAVMDHLNGGTMLDSFTEVESGRRNDRPELAKALDLCRRKKATLVIAKLDRLARNVAFIANLMDANRGRHAAGQPFDLAHNGRNGQAALKGAEAVVGKADTFAANVAPIIREVQAAGIETLQGIADALNARGIKTARGRQWAPATVRNVLLRQTRADTVSDKAA